MKKIANLLFEAKILKDIPRSGYHFLGKGKESIAEHSFIITFIAFVISRLEPEVDALKLISMCLLHDLPEARTGDLNSVHKRYVTADEQKAVEDMTRDIPFGDSITELIEEYEEGKTKEAQLSRDADQLAFILDLKAFSDGGHSASEKWLPYVLDRVKTDTGKKIIEGIMAAESDAWWFKDFDAENKKS